MRNQIEVSSLKALKVESDSEKTGIVTCNKQDLREIFEEMFKVKETGNHLYNAARQNQNRARQVIPTGIQLYPENQLPVSHAISQGI